MRGSLSELLAKAFLNNWSAPAIHYDGRSVSYSELAQAAGAVAMEIRERVGPGRRVAILADRSLGTYIALLGCVLGGWPYVPVGVNWPSSRQSYVLKAAACDVIFSSKEFETPPLADRDIVIIHSKNLERSDFWPSGDNAKALIEDTVELADDRPVYVMFTSGTTGAPKGVEVTRSNLSAYLRGIKRIAPLSPGTRCTQLFELTFDLSVHDLFQTWSSGACLYLMSAEDTLDPLGFARRYSLQAWFSVPSVLGVAKRMRQLKPGALPDLQLSLFCGEALPTSLTREWASVAPASRILNLYGPTEATIAITAHEFDRNRDAIDDPVTMPLWTPLEESAFAIVNEQRDLSLEGELWLAGSQISAGYINSETENSERFLNIMLAGQSNMRWYRTGDLVKSDETHGILFCGRVDEQVKINGYRIELFEIEEAMRRGAATMEVAAIPWPRSDSGLHEYVVGFVCASTQSEDDIISFCRDRLPPYMVPKRIHFLDTLPLNSNGKVDRKALSQLKLNGG